MSKTHKILISPAFGSGWSTAMGDNDEVFKFALTYEPLIKFIEGGGTFTNSSDYNLLWINNETCDTSNLHPVLKQFVEDAFAKFGKTANVYIGGARGLTVETVTGPFRISEYDGYESLVTENDFISLD